LALREKYAVRFIFTRGSYLYRACANKLVGVTVQGAKDHDEWYSEYLEKKEANKEAIANWRYQKELQKSEQVKLIKESVEQAASTIAKNESSKEQERRAIQKYEIALWKKEKERESILHDSKENPQCKKPVLKAKPRPFYKFEVNSI
jgi:ATPase subunit of ABC transporter with duplicated ATPase domains